MSSNSSQRVIIKFLDKTLVLTWGNHNCRFNSLLITLWGKTLKSMGFTPLWIRCLWQEKYKHLSPTNTDHNPISTLMHMELKDGARTIALNLHHIHQDWQNQDPRHNTKRNCENWCYNLTYVDSSICNPGYTPTRLLTPRHESYTQLGMGNQHIKTFCIKESTSVTQNKGFTPKFYLGKVMDSWRA